MTDYTELKRLAEAWRDYKLNNMSSTAEHIGMLFVHKRNFEQAVSPDVILQMIAEIDRLRLHIKHIGNDALRTQNQALMEALKTLYVKLTPNVNGADEHCFLIGMRKQVTQGEMRKISEAIAQAEGGV